MTNSGIAIDKIWVNDPGLFGDVVEQDPKNEHRNHFHVRIIDPDGSLN